MSKETALEVYKGQEAFYKNELNNTPLYEQGRITELLAKLSEAQEMAYSIEFGKPQVNSVEGMLERLMAI